MWELDYKESWAPKNWCFWATVLEKTRESPLDCKEIQPVHSKGDQSWVLIGRTDVEAEAPILYPHDTKSWLIWKDPDAGKDWRLEEKGTTAHEMVGGHHLLNGREFGQTPGLGDGQGGLACCSPWVCKESDTTERLNWTDLDVSSKFEEIALWQCTELPETFGFRYLFGFPHNVDWSVYSAKRKVLISGYRSQWSCKEFDFKLK